MFKMRILILIAAILLSNVLSAQIDTTGAFDTSQNESRCGCENGLIKPFSEVVYEFRTDSGLSYVTLAAWFSSKASGGLLWKVRFTPEQVKRMESGAYIPSYKNIEAIKRAIALQKN